MSRAMSKFVLIQNCSNSAPVGDSNEQVYNYFQKLYVLAGLESYPLIKQLSAVSLSPHYVEF